MAAAIIARRRIERRDLWWLEPLAVVIVLGTFVAYSAWAGLQNSNYYADPYLSPFYSPCLSANCTEVTFPLIGSWWVWSPAILIVPFPLVFRLTCYYYRRSYYRAFFWAPPACVVPDARHRYSGESKFPFLLQNLHRYAFYAAVLVLAILAYDAIRAFGFRDGIHLGVGTLIMVANVGFLSLFTFSCHSCRNLCGGYLDQFHNAPLRFRLWSAVNRLNVRHGLFAWLSLFSVGLTDVYIRLVASGALTDLRIL